jgi:hypothetical protein
MIQSARKGIFRLPGAGNVPQKKKMPAAMTSEGEVATGIRNFQAF